MMESAVPNHVRAPKSHFSCYKRARVNYCRISGHGILMYLLTGDQCGRLSHTMVEAGLGQRGHLLLLHLGPFVVDVSVESLRDWGSGVHCRRR